MRCDAMRYDTLLAVRKLKNKCGQPRKDDGESAKGLGEKGRWRAEKWRVESKGHVGCDGATVVDVNAESCGDCRFCSTWGGCVVSARLSATGSSLRWKIGTSSTIIISLTLVGFFSL
jgi:hypothetical protein